MTKRRKAREKVVQILYQKDMRGDKSTVIKADSGVMDKSGPETWEFIEKLVRGTMESLADIDRLIEKGSDNWHVSRMGVVDRNILRMSVYEMISDKDIPLKVSLDEAIELAKSFANDESSKFINGVLDKIKKEIEANPGAFENGVPQSKEKKDIKPDPGGLEKPVAPSGENKKNKPARGKTFRAKAPKAYSRGRRPKL